MVIALNNLPEIDKRFQSYYTNSHPIVQYMVKQLELKPNDVVLEPSAGEGAFVDEILHTGINVKMTLIELNEDANSILKSKYFANKKMQILRENFFYHENYLHQKFDKIIANPPYGAWIDYDERKILKDKFKAIATKETYTLFLYNAIQLLEENGILVFIIPETFLYLHSHTKLRQYLLKNTLIKELVIFSSSFFPYINFGYGRLSIITLQKKELINNPEHQFTLSDKLNTPDDLLNLTQKKYFAQNDILRNKDSAFYFTEDEVLKNLMNNSEQTLADIAECVTGIYTGNNEKYFRVLTKEVKNSLKYQLVAKDKISLNHKSLEGIKSNQCFIPVARGAGKSQFFKDNEWYIDWSEKAVEHYTKDAKARFQNTRFYFKKGIGLPMVKTKKSTAFLINESVFEQSVVGIFPKEEKYFNYLLAFFNSTIASKLINLINPTANNSANYIKKIPMMIPTTRELEYIDTVVNCILNTLRFTDMQQQQIDNFFETLYKKTLH